MKRYVHSSTQDELSNLSAQGILNYLDQTGYKLKFYVNGWEEYPNYAAKMLENSSLTYNQLDDLKNGDQIKVDNCTFRIEYEFD